VKDQAKDVKRLQKPKDIRAALYASSAYVLRKAFQKDPIVQRLIKTGRNAAPSIEKEIRAKGLKLTDITLASYAYILQIVDREAALRALLLLFARSLRKPSGPFFVQFAAHALRQITGLPLKLQLYYTDAELQETLHAARNLKESNI